MLVQAALAIIVADGRLEKKEQQFVAGLSGGPGISQTEFQMILKGAGVPNCPIARPVMGLSRRARALTFGDQFLSRTTAPH